MSKSERPLDAVPRWVLGFLASAFALQLALAMRLAPAPNAAKDLPAPPRTAILRVISMGEPAAAARLAMLYLQSFDYHGGNSLPYRSLDYDRLIGWLGAILGLDPLSHYPLFAAAHVYAEVSDPARLRKMLEFIYSAFLDDPDRHWPALAHATLIAKHRLRDLPLSLKYAQAIDRKTKAADVPLWARQMELFILEDLNELDAARIMLGGLLANGRIRDAAERKHFERRLKGLEERSGGAGEPKRK